MSFGGETKSQKKQEDILKKQEAVKTQQQTQLQQRALQTLKRRRAAFGQGGASSLFDQTGQTLG